MYEIMIVFKDGEKLILSGVTDYIIKDNYYEVHKNGFRMFFNFNEVKYIGRTFDIEGKGYRGD